MGWQPIETAPKDGTSVLGFFPKFAKGHRLCVCYYVVSDAYEYGKLRRHREYWQGGGWFNDSDPTHWTPLPEEPK